MTHPPASIEYSTTATPKVWLITGCSSGLGLVLARTVLERGDNVIATARDSSRIALQPRENLRLLQLDVTATQESLDQKITLATTFFGHIDVLVNNAGYVLTDVWEEISKEQIFHQMDTNVFGPLRVTKAILPHFRSRSCGSVIFISSIAGWVGAAAGGPYSASKFALEGAVECLQKEVSQFNIETSLIVLGQFRTSILESNNRKSAGSSSSSSSLVYGEVYKSVERRHEATDGKQPGDPVKAARHIVDIVHREGELKGKENLPLRFFLGSDCARIVRTRCTEILNLLDDQAQISCHTDFIDGQGVPSYQ